MVDIYADQGITGTSASKRPQFMRMMKDAADGKIDLILCKSISRFSRNFADAQRYIHFLKSLNIEVRFEKEGINSMDPSSDLIFGMMAAVAQEESRSISENVKWTYRKLAEFGTRHVGDNHMLGYDERNGKLVPNGDAWIVKLILEEYALGFPISLIIKHLEEKGARRIRSSKKYEWSVISRILKNEAYVGDRLLQKSATVDYLTKKPEEKESVFDCKYIFNDHEGIIPPAIWEAVQKRFEKQTEMRRQKLYKQCTSHFLYGKVFCAECGAPYTRFTVKNGDGSLSKTWHCRKRAHKGECRNRNIKEENLIKEICKALEWEKLETELFNETVDTIQIKNAKIDIKVRK